MEIITPWGWSRITKENSQIASNYTVLKMLAIVIIVVVIEDVPDELEFANGDVRGDY